jgi:uncharacterized RmlC-like cupin family protein
MRKAKVIRSKDVEAEKTDNNLLGTGAPAGYVKGICSKTVENPPMVMTFITLPPGQRIRRHYHVKGDVGVYIFKGSMRVFFGPDNEIEEAIAEAGDYIFAPQGTIHAYLNLSDTEPCEYISVCVGIGDIKEAGHVWVEPKVDG